ncbi:MAG: hypothetical protein KGZ88_11785 [Methylomicrobium sp.]|nr:hypothetical protein [Methylomicrobium sp.]
MDRITQLENAVITQHHTIKQLASEVLALRAFALAVLEQPAINLQQLRDTYVELWEQAVQQMPPEMQDQAALQKLLIEIEHELNRQDQGGA